MSGSRGSIGPLAWSFLAAAWLGVLGAGVGAIVTGGWTDPLVFLAGASAFGVGGVAWALVIERPEAPTLVRGLLVGAATGLLAHFVLWLLFTLALAGGIGPTGIGVTAALGLLGLLFLGPITIPIGALGGGVFALVRSRTGLTGTVDG